MVSPSALRSLLLAGRLSVSTQEAVRPAAKAAPEAIFQLLACWAWLSGVVLAVIAGLVSGGQTRALAAAAALALAPALAGFLLWPRLTRRNVALGYVAAWSIVATGLVAGSGGPASPLTAAFLIGPALALTLGRRWAPEAGAAAVLGFAVSVWLARGEPPAALGAFPEALAVVAIAFAAGLMALGQRVGGKADGASQRIAEVSHELRTPLTHILGFSEMIERQIFGEISERYVEYAGLIRRSGSHLLDLVNDLLDLSRIDAGRYELALEEIDVRNLVADVVRLSAPSAEKKNIALGVITPEAPLLARVDQRALNRMMMNVLGNALKFTPEGGRVMISAAEREGELVIETIDTGPGIPEADREKLGQPYERGSGGALAEGTGLGLSLVRAMAALHGGRLSFHDAPGGGALVRITLPVLISDRA